MTSAWRSIWNHKTDTQETWLKVAIVDNKVVSAEWFLKRETRKKTFYNSIGIPPDKLLELCVALEPIHTKMLQRTAKRNVQEIAKE